MLAVSHSNFCGADTAGRAVSCTFLFAFSAWIGFLMIIPAGGLIQSAVATIPYENDRTFDRSDDGDDRAFGWSIDEEDDRTFNWSIDEEDEDDDDGVRSAAAAVRQLDDDDDDVYAGKMKAFFAKLSSLWRKRREDRRRKSESSSSEPGRRVVSGAASRPQRPGDDRGRSPANGDQELRQQGLPSPPPTSDAERDRKSGFRPGNDRSDLETDGGAADDASPPPRFRDLGGDGLVIRPQLQQQQQAPVQTVQRRRHENDRADPGTRDDPRRRPAGYLHMGLNSARCVWRRYRADAASAAADDAGREQRLRSARAWLVDAARFWAAAVGLSVAVLWAAFGSFHWPFCGAAFAAPSAAYDRDVNRYLNTVPPHAVVTGRAKMFRYQPTAEERFLWTAAKRMAGFKVLSRHDVYNNIS